MSAEAVHFFFGMREQLKLYHWQTTSYARHKATDEVLDALDKIIDEFVETYMGKYGRPRLGPKTNTVKVVNMTEKTAVRFVQACIKSIQGPLSAGLKPTDTDLLNLRDEMLGELNKVLYLFSLH